LAEVATSYEVRWFFTGEVPDPVVERFGPEGRGTRSGPADSTPSNQPGPVHAGPDHAWPPPRTDRYLSFAADMGLKLRAEPDRVSLLEIKGRQRLDGAVRLAPGVEGLASTWIKWSYRAEEAPAALLEACRDDESSTPVEKRRLLRRFRLDPGAPPEEVDLDERLTRGVQLELTRLRFPKGPGDSALASGWTLGLEAFPVSPGLAAAARTALAGPLRALAGSGATLDLTHSASYPDWLLARTKGQRPVI
jgi:hypothetical protein